MQQNKEENAILQNDSEGAIQNLSEEALEEVTGGMPFGKAMHHIGSKVSYAAKNGISFKQIVSVARDRFAERKQDKMNAEDERPIRINSNYSNY